MSATLSRIRVASGIAAILAACATSSVAQTTERVSVGSAGEEGDGSSWHGVLSRDGRYVAFATWASSLDPADTNGTEDVYRHDRITGATVRVSVDSSGAEANGPSVPYGISDDGNLVVFVSEASNLVAGDNNAYRDAFVRDIATGTTERVSVDSAGNESDGYCFDAAISGDGRNVVFSDSGTNLVAGGAGFRTEVYLRDRSNGTTMCVSVNNNGNAADKDCLGSAISGDGNFVTFTSSATNLVGKDPYTYVDVFMRDLVASKTSQISLRPDGGRPFGDSWSASISDSGNRVAFLSSASNIVTGDHSGWDVFVRDVPSATTLRASLSSDGDEPNQDCLEGCISGDGAFVAFVSRASNLVPGDVNGFEDVFVRSLSNSMTTCESVAGDGTQADWFSGDVAISDDGSAIGFDTRADNLVGNDTNGVWDVFVRSRVIVSASDSAYGTGYAGTNGIPNLSIRAAPILNTIANVDIGNSSGAWSLAFLVLGTAATDVATNRGGHLLVVPAGIGVLPLPPAGTTLAETVPPREELAGAHAYLQVLEIDPGAPFGFSFTAALDLGLGY